MSIVAAMIPVGMALNAASKMIHSRRDSAETPFPDVLRESMGSRMVKRWDTDGDGVLSVSEFGGSAKTFARLDTDGDGALKAGELDAGLARAQFQRRAHSHSDAAMHLYDSNHDGVLTAAEFGRDMELFESIDANGDGKIDRAEMLGAYMRSDRSSGETEGA